MSLDNKEVTLNFIEDYRTLEVLWNSDIKGYTNKQMRVDALQELSFKYSVSVDAVKKKIKSLRSYFCKEHNKNLKNKSDVGIEDNNSSNWFAYKHLLFIADPSSPLPIRDNIGSHHSDLEEDSQNEMKDVLELELEDLPSTNTSNFSEPVGNRIKKRKLNISTIDERENEMYEFRKSVHQHRKNEDEYIVFGELIAHKIRKLGSARLRFTAQHQISNILFELEMSEENEEHSGLISSH